MPDAPTPRLRECPWCGTDAEADKNTNNEPMAWCKNRKCHAYHFALRVEQWNGRPDPLRELRGWLRAEQSYHESMDANGRGEKNVNRSKAEAYRVVQEWLEREGGGWK